MYVGAVDNDFTPIILGGLIASDNIKRIHFVGEISNIISFRALMKLL